MKTQPPSNVPTALRHAADLIEKKGWRQGIPPFDADTPWADRPMCAGSAIDLANGKHYENADECKNAVGDYISPGVNKDNVVKIIDWNDACERTAKEVVDTFHVVANLLDKVDQPAKNLVQSTVKEKL